MKKLICTILAASMLLSVAPLTFAEETEIADKQFQNMALTIDGAIDYALEHNLGIQQKEAALKRSKHEETQARRTYNDYNSMGTSIEEALIESGYYYRAAQIQAASAERALAAQKNALITEIKLRFYTCLNYKAKIQSAAESLTSAQNNYTYAQTKYEQGAISALELNTFKSAVTSAQTSYNTVVRNYELAVRYLKYGLNIPQTTEITPVGEFVLPELTYADDKTAIELAKNQNSYLSISEGRELAELRFKIANGWYSSNELGYSIELENYTANMSAYEVSEAELEYGIYSAYSGLLTVKETLGLMNESLDLLRQSMEAAHLQFELGMITADEYVEYEQKYYNAKNDYIDTQLTYYTTALQYITAYNGSADI